MQGLITKVVKYEKDGKLKAMVTIVGEDGSTDDLFCSQTELAEKGLEAKCLTPDDFAELVEKYESVEYQPSSKMAKLL